MDAVQAATAVGWTLVLVFAGAAATLAARFHPLMAGSGVTAAALAAIVAYQIAGISYDWRVAGAALALGCGAMLPAWLGIAEIQPRRRNRSLFSGIAVGIAIATAAVSPPRLAAIALLVAAVSIALAWHASLMLAEAFRRPGLKTKGRAPLTPLVGPSRPSGDASAAVVRRGRSDPPPAAGPRRTPPPPAERRR